MSPDSLAESSEPDRSSRTMLLPHPPPSLLLAGRVHPGSRRPPPPKSSTANILPTVPVDGHQLRSAVTSLMNPRQFLPKEERFPTGQRIPFSYGYPNYPKPVVSPVVSPLYVFHDALRANEPTSKSEPLTGYSVFPTSPARCFHLWLLRDRATPTSGDVLLGSPDCTTNLPFWLGWRSSWNGGAQLR